MLRYFSTFLAIAVLACTILPLQAQDKPTDVSGAWKLTIETPMGAITSDLTIKLDGDKITGELNSERGGLAIAGTVDKETIKFAGEVNGFTLTFSGKPGPLAMLGTVDFGGNGSASWSAIRP